MRYWMILVPLLISACASAPPPAPAETSVPLEFPSAFYQDTKSPNRVLYRIDPHASEILIRVGRTGSLAHLGHEHVLAARNIKGGVSIDDDPARSRADIYFALAELEFDTLALRERVGLEGQLTEDEIAQTRKHLLSDVLDAERAPWVVISATWLPGTKPKSELLVQITLNDVTQTLRVPVLFEQDAGRIQASGQFRIRQTAFGLKPYSLFGGALAVEDWLNLSFQIEAPPQEITRAEARYPNSPAT